MHLTRYILVRENFHFCAVTPCRLADNQCPAHLLYGLWLSHSHVLGERSSLADGGRSAEPHPPSLPPSPAPPHLSSSLLAGVSGREDDHLLPQLPSDWTTAFPYGTVPLSIVCLRLVGVCAEASTSHLTCLRVIVSGPFFFCCCCSRS